MALRAAERDNGELQARLHHMPTSSRSHHRHQGEPTARQLWAVPRERGAAYGSTAVSPVSRYALGPPSPALPTYNTDFVHRHYCFVLKVGSPCLFLLYVPQICCEPSHSKWCARCDDSVLQVQRHI